MGDRAGATRTDFSSDYGDFEGRVWLNCAHQGPIPLAAAAEAREAVEWKLSPSQLTTDRFSGVPDRIRTALSRLVRAPVDEITLANSASYGLHLLANGVPLDPGDEVLLMEGDFPSNVLPWLDHRHRGVEVRLLRPEREMLRPEEVAANISTRTRALCMSWVHSFSGRVADLESIGRICRRRGVRLLVNGSQAVGARSVDLGSLPIDAMVSVGFKWLCGPYGTGFLWMRPDLRESLRYNQAYWLSMQTAEDLAREQAVPTVRNGLGARKYDVFGTANFFNFKTWAASVEYLLHCGPARIEDHDQGLVSRFLAGLDRRRFRVLSPVTRGERTTLVFVSHAEPDRNPSIHATLREAGIDIALRRGRLRIAPHLYNTPAEIDRALDALHAAAAS